MSNKQSIEILPIGIVTTDVADDDVARQRRTMVSEIQIFEEYAAGLKGIEEYSHIIVLFWMHRVDRSPRQLVHPRGDPSLPLTGVLASRGRGHPNPIGFAVAELIARDGPRLTVRRLDAYHGTPVIDVKPYDQYDVCIELRTPQWFSEQLARKRSTDAQSSG
jgi:tRNA-Thr(GGU) m(6)t(6)A37 methyltransferase TsaA